MTTWPDIVKMQRFHSKHHWRGGGDSRGFGTARTTLPWLLVNCLLAWQVQAAGSFPGKGLASGYPGDAGIEHDPHLLFVENFEEGSLQALGQRWDDVHDLQGMSFSQDVPPGSRDKQSIVMERLQGSGPSLYRRLKNKEGGWGADRIFARFYVKFAPDCGDLHHFGTCLGGHNPPLRWPAVKAGYPTDGATSFWTEVEPCGSRWVWDFYTYWCDMRGSPPQGRTWGNSFIQDPSLKVQKGKWICIEEMVKLNDPGKTNGELALWVDGKQVSHLGPGFPKGLWRYDRFYPGKGGEGVRWNRQKGVPEYFKVPPGEAPFEGFQWRTTDKLNLNFLWLYVYTEKPPGYRIKVWFDDVVVATSYIGPLQR